MNAVWFFIAVFFILAACMLYWMVWINKREKIVDEKYNMLRNTLLEAERLRDYVTGNGGMHDLNTLRDLIHKNAVEHGWWESERSFSEVVALCHSELSEALEEDRKGAPAEYVVDAVTGSFVTDPGEFLGRKPEGIAVEMADCMIRILDWFGRMDLDACEIVERKMEYNKHRPYKHGKRF